MYPRLISNSSPISLAFTSQVLGLSACTIMPRVTVVISCFFFLVYFILVRYFNHFIEMDLYPFPPPLF